ncbi:ribonuclease E activity regulator RraA [Glycocaulis sp.]|uniref:ribonuclease E activity regulator RraA n=1 Tax=Glycocaulis sp. TaxID=1969725 RepID=UPI003D1E3AB5
MPHTADLCDAWPDKVRVLAPLFTHYGGRQVFHGPVETILAYEDNSRVREALSEAGEGRVLVIDGGASLRRSMVGGDLAKLAAKNGWAGILVHGAVRDAHELEAEPVGVLALGLIPRKTEKRGLGTRGLSVSFGGVTFAPGDWLYADRDGVVVSAGELRI